jgi:hypothetical protein
MCDVAACKGLVMTNRNTPPWTDMESIVVQDMAKIGIGVVPRELETGAAYQTIQTVKNDIPIALNAGWGRTMRTRTRSGAVPLGDQHHHHGAVGQQIPVRPVLRLHLADPDRGEQQGHGVSEGPVPRLR